MTFGTLFKKYRQQAKLSQQKLAELMGIKDKKSIRQWEKGVCVPYEMNVYRAIEVFYQWGVIGSVADAKELWDLASTHTEKGFSIEFNPQRFTTILEEDLAQKIRIIIQPSLSNTTPKVGESITAKFSITNICAQTIFLEELALCCRLGNTWSDTWADFPHIKKVVLKPHGEFHYEEKRSFSLVGKYFGECVALINNRWDGLPQDNIPKYPRVFFYVS